MKKQEKAGNRVQKIIIELEIEVVNTSILL